MKVIEFKLKYLNNFWEKGIIAGNTGVKYYNVLSLP